MRPVVAGFSVSFGLGIRAQGCFACVTDNSRSVDGPYQHDVPLVLCDVVYQQPVVLSVVLLLCASYCVGFCLVVCGLLCCVCLKRLVLLAPRSPLVRLATYVFFMVSFNILVSAPPFLAFVLAQVFFRLASAGSCF